MLIDWLTLRHPIDSRIGKHLHEKIMLSMGQMVNFSPSGEILWQKAIVDWDSLRSDSSGLYWSVTADADSVRYLTIGASPSSLENSGVNVFGSTDLKHCSEVLIHFAGKALGAILPDWKFWQCRRLDITANYDMGSPGQVAQALRLLLGTDAPRRRTNSLLSGGDTVYWNPSSTLRMGKAYAKGAHLRYQLKKGNISLDEETLLLADKLIRLELRLGSRWFRRLDIDWHLLTPEILQQNHFNFFSSVIGDAGVEVSDMGTLLQELEKVAPSKGRALAAHRTWALIKVLGYTQTKQSMSLSTFANHCVWLRAAGLSSADLCAGTVIPFRQKMLVLGQPVQCWDDLRRAA